MLDGSGMSLVDDIIPSYSLADCQAPLSYDILGTSTVRRLLSSVHRCIIRIYYLSLARTFPLMISSLAPDDSVCGML